MNKAFTLVELIVVIAIIGLLATIGISSYNNTLNESKRTKALADIKEIEDAIKIYNIRTGTWPCGSSVCNGSYNISTQATWNASTTGLVPTYLETVPLDPWGMPYFYDGAPNNECGEGEVSICSGGQNKTIESHNNPDIEVVGDDVCVFLQPDC